MKRIRTMKIEKSWVLAIAVVLAAVSLPVNRTRADDDTRFQGEGCSKASFKGSFGLTTTGVIVVVGDFAVVGKITADGQGNLVDGSFTQSLNGVISRGTFTGTYEVNPDCSGSATLNLASGPTAHRDIVIVDDGREVRGISTDSGTVLTVNLKKQLREDN